MPDLPVELCFYMMKFLSVKQLLRLRRLSTAWHTLIAHAIAKRLRIQRPGNSKDGRVDRYGLCALKARGLHLLGGHTRIINTRQKSTSTRLLEMVLECVGVDEVIGACNPYRAIQSTVAFPTPLLPKPPRVSEVTLTFRWWHGEKAFWLDGTANGTWESQTVALGFSAGHLFQTKNYKLDLEKAIWHDGGSTEIVDYEEGIRFKFLADAPGRRLSPEVRHSS